MNPNSLSTNIAVTLLTVVMVVVLPWLDRKICLKLGVSLTDGVSDNPKADRLLHLRKYLLIFVFCIYLLLVAYVAFLSRSAMDDYAVHIDLYHDLASTLRIDFGFLGFLHTLFTEGFRSAAEHVKVGSLENVAQVYMNVCMFIPMGYLLPYVFDWFRVRPKFRTVTVCFLASLAVENLQLATRLGYYDIDDLASNTIGGFAGVLLYISFARALTNPEWKKDNKRVRIWRRDSRKKALYPFFRKIHISRATVFAKDRNEVMDFFMSRLGMYLEDTETDAEGNVSLLFYFGKNQIEVRCPKKELSLPAQTITIACNNSEYMKRRLEKQGVKVSDYKADIYSGLRTFEIYGPDNMTITIIEE